MYVIFPVFSSISAPSGAPSPNLKVVPSGFVVSFPSLSVKLGAVIVVGLPTSASASVYLGSTLSDVFSVLSSSQTAYTVFASVMSFKIPSSAAVAVLLLAQPRNLYPSLVGSFGAVTDLSSFVVTFLVVVASSNLPPFASNVTSFSSDHIA